MVTRHRLNLSLSEIDFQRLSVLAKAEGKMPSTFALDYLKALLLGNGSMTPKRIKAPVAPSNVDRHTLPLLPPESLSEGSKRALAAQYKRDRKSAKRGK